MHLPIVSKGDCMSADRPPRAGRDAPVSAAAGRGTPATGPMLVPSNAWRILNARTGGAISRSTFYRWLSSGQVYSVRVGHRLLHSLARHRGADRTVLGRREDRSLTSMTERRTKGQTEESTAHGGRAGL